jgi:hypothetical protein
MWITECRGGFAKIDFVLAEILDGFRDVPCEPKHRENF